MISGHGVITSERCFIRALFIILAICAVCSIVPDRYGEKRFCMLCSINLLPVRKEYIALRRHNVNTFSGIDSSVIGSKLEGIYTRVAFLMNKSA